MRETGYLGTLAGIPSHDSCLEQSIIPVTLSSMLIISLYFFFLILNLCGNFRYCLVASKQMVGIFLTVWVRSEIRDDVKNMKVSCVGRGLMGYLGNKVYIYSA